MKRCESCFLAWQRELRTDPDRWMVRSIAEGKLWMNEATCYWANWRAERVIPWDAAVRFMTQESARLVEDAHSRTLKTGRMEVVTFTGRAWSNKPTKLRNVVQAYRCANCPKGGCLVLILAHEV